MANMFDSFKSSGNGKKGTFNTRSATPCTCIALRTAVFHNKFKDNAEEQKFQLLFQTRTADGTVISQWSPWMNMGIGMFHPKSKVMEIFDKQKNVLENVGDPEWLFSQQWEVLGIANGDKYVNIKTIYWTEGGIKNAEHYDLAGYPPYSTCKCYSETAPIQQMIVRLEDGTAHEVEQEEFKAYQPATNDGDDGLPF